MTRRSANRSVADLLAAMDSEPDVSTAVTASMVNRQTAERMFNMVQRAKEHLSARFVGGSADRHELTARAATHALLSVQESVTYIGARILGHTTLKGRLPDAILAATELRFSPNVLPGSVVFELSRATDAESMVEGEPERPVLDESFDKLFDLLNSVATAAAPGAIPRRVQALGPRAAKHIFDLCQVLVDEGMGLDFEWRNRTGQTREARLSNSGARYLKGIAKESNAQVTSRDVLGVLLTASVESKQNLKLRTDDGEVISMAASDAIRANLGDHYNRAVRARVETTDAVNLTTGIASSSHRLVSIESVGAASSTTSTEESSFNS